MDNSISLDDRPVTAPGSGLTIQHLHDASSVVKMPFVDDLYLSQTIYAQYVQCNISQVCMDGESIYR